MVSQKKTKKRTVHAKTKTSQTTKRPMLTKDLILLEKKKQEAERIIIESRSAKKIITTQRKQLDQLTAEKKSIQQERHNLSLELKLLDNTKKEIKKTQHQLTKQLALLEHEKEDYDNKKHLRAQAKKAAELERIQQELREEKKQLLQLYNEIKTELKTHKTAHDHKRALLEDAKEFIKKNLQTATTIITKDTEALLKHQYHVNHLLYKHHDQQQHLRARGMRIRKQEREHTQQEKIAEAEQKIHASTPELSRREQHIEEEREERRVERRVGKVEEREAREERAVKHAPAPSTHHITHQLYTIQGLIQAQDLGTAQECINALHTHLKNVEPQARKRLGYELKSLERELTLAKLV